MRNDDIDPAGFLIALNRARIRYLLIGRQALVHYGVPAQTMDYDLWLDPSVPNVRKILRIAEEMGLEGPTSSEALQPRPFFSLFGGTLKVDIFKVRRFTNLDGKSLLFAAAYERRVVARVEGDPLALPLPSLKDLRLLKRMRDSAKDREDLRYIDALEAAPGTLPRRRTPGPRRRTSPRRQKSRAR